MGTPRRFVQRAISRILVLSLLASLVNTFSASPGMATSTVTKVVNVKGLNGSNYQNALVKAIYYNKTDGTEGSSSLVATDSNGNASITYNSDIDSGYIVIEPASGDLVHAVGVIQSLQSITTSTINFTLKKAHLQLKVLNSDDSDASVGTSVYITKFYFQLLRTGAFGVNGDDLILGFKSNSITIMPASNVLNQLMNGYYFTQTKTDSGWSYKVYSDLGKTSEIAPTSGFYSLRFKSSTVKVVIKNSDGSPLALPTGIRIYGEAFRVDSSGNQVWEQFGDNSSSEVNSSGEWYGALGITGKYSLAFYSNNSDSVPSFYYGDLWSNGADLVSSTSADSGFPSPGQVLNIETRIPSTFLAINFKDRETGELTSFGANITKKIGSTYSGYTGFINNVWTENGKAAISLSDGDYKFNFSSIVTSVYYVRVASGIYTVTDSNNVNLSPVDGKYIFYNGLTNLKMKVSSGGSGLEAIMTNLTTKSENYLYADGNGLLRGNFDNGSYILLLQPSGEESPIRGPNRYSIKIAGGVVAEFKVQSSGETITADSNGFYGISLTDPKFTGTIALSGSTFPTQARINLTAYKVETISPKEILTVANPTRISVNDSGNFGTTLDSGKYRFALRSDYQNSKIYTSTSECEVPINLVANCSISVPIENLKLTVSNQNGQLMKGDYYLQFEQIKELSTTLYGNAYPDPTTGVITGRLADGNYLFRFNPYYPESDVGAAKSFRLTVVGGVVTRMVDIATDSEVAAVDGVYPLYLQKTNFRGLLKNAGIAVSNASVTGQNLEGKSDTSWSNTNNEGKFTIFLGEGNNDVTVRPRGDESPVKSPHTYRVVVRNGAVTSVKDSAGTEVVSVDGFYPLGFESPNVSGSITLGTVAQSGALYAQRLDTSGKFFQWTNQYANISESGGYAIKLDPGKYIFTLYLNNRQNLISNVCEVPVTGNVTCSTDFPSANLKFDVSDNAGIKLTSGFYTSPEYTTSIGVSASSCCMYPLAGVSTQELSLLNGTYRIYINPDSSLPNSNISNFYTVKVESGAITSVLEGRALTPILPDSNGTYSFKFVSPSVSGTVVAYDGTTPVPNVQIQLTNSNSGNGVSSNSNGVYAFGYVSDGQYELVAYPDAQDITQFRSDIQTVTVLNGVASNQVIIQLKKPNVSGIVSGPTGLPSKYNWLNVRKLDSNGYYQYLEKMWGRSTNGVGKYSYYLPPGTYIFEVNADSAVKGVRTTSAPCVVQAGVDKVCDITLASANLKFKVTNSANVALPYSSGWYWLTEKVTEVVARDGWMNIDGNGNSQIFLEDGTWYLRVDPPYNNSSSSTANFRVTVSGGAVTSVKDIGGTTLTATDDVYNFQLPSGNLVGEITIGGVKTTYWNSVSVKAWNGNGFYDIQNRGFEGGTFGFKVDPGLYRVEARPSTGPESLIATSKSAVCEVFETGTTTCNIALQNANLLGSVKTPLGDNFREVWAYIYSVNDKGENWEQSVNLYDGNFAAYLENGTYRLRVEPYWEKRSLYPVQDYTVVVAGGVVTSVINRLTLATVVKSGDRYTFVLSSPSVTGYVYMPGTSTEKVSNIQVAVIDSNGRERWEYSTSSDASGKFGLNLPDGSYDLVARPWGSGKTYTTSAKVRITVASGVVAGGDLTLRLRAPNVWGVIVKPDGSTPLGEANINIYMNGEYAYAWTASDGAFGAYFENAVPSPCGNCQIYISHNNTTDYSSKIYTFAALGNLANLAIGGVNVRATVLYPESGGATSPSKWGYVAIEEFDGTNYLWQPGSNTNELGKVGLSLTSGKSYRITAYPGWERGGDFVPKTTTITNFDPTNAAHTALTITFLTPNISFVVKDRANQANSWGWYQVNKLNSTTNSYEYYINGYLNDQGRGSQLLEADGTYQITFWPGKAAGIEKTLTITVATGVVSLNGSPLTTTTSVTLPTGNVSGRIISAASTPVPGATVAAIRSDDPTKIVSTVALSDGTFELGLDLSFAWDIKSLDPITGKRATVTLPIVAGRASNATLALGEITVVTP